MPSTSKPLPNLRPTHHLKNSQCLQMISCGHYLELDNGWMPSSVKFERPGVCLQRLEHLTRHVRVWDSMGSRRPEQLR